MMTHLDLDNSLDMLMIGRTGDGKSATGNTILGRNTFEASVNTSSKTFKAQSDYSEFQGRILKVVDCPGLGDTKLGPEDDVKQLVTAINTAIAENPKGYHAILYVVRVGRRFCKEDSQTMQILKTVLGEDFIKKHTILLFSGGDDFETNPEIKQKSLSFDDWIKIQDNQHFKELVGECQRRVILFDNRTSDLKKQAAQKEKLVGMINSLATKGKRYTNENFEKAEKKRQDLLAKLGKEQEKQNVIDKIGILTAQVKNVTLNNTGAEALQEISTEIEALLKASTEGAKKNSKLKDTFKLFKAIQQAVDAKKIEIEKNRNIQDKREQWEEDKLKLEHLRTKEQLGKTSGELDEVKRRIQEQEQALKKREEEIRKLEEENKRLREKEGAGKIMEDLEKTYFEAKNSKDSASLITPILEYAASLTPVKAALTSAYNWWMGK